MPAKTGSRRGTCASYSTSACVCVCVLQIYFSCGNYWNFPFNFVVAAGATPSPPPWPKNLKGFSTEKKGKMSKWRVDATVGVCLCFCVLRRTDKFPCISVATTTNWTNCSKTATTITTTRGTTTITKQSELNKQFTCRVVVVVVLVYASSSSSLSLAAYPSPFWTNNFISGSQMQRSAAKKNPNKMLTNWVNFNRCYQCEQRNFRKVKLI